MIALALAFVLGLAAGAVLFACMVRHAAVLYFRDRREFGVAWETFARLVALGYALRLPAPPPAAPPSTSPRLDAPPPPKARARPSTDPRRRAAQARPALRLIRGGRDAT